MIKNGNLAISGTVIIVVGVALGRRSKPRGPDAHASLQRLPGSSGGRCLRADSFGVLPRYKQGAHRQDVSKKLNIPPFHSSILVAIKNRTETGTEGQLHERWQIVSNINVIGIVTEAGRPRRLREQLHRGGVPRVPQAERLKPPYPPPTLLSIPRSVTPSSESAHDRPPCLRHGAKLHRRKPRKVTARLRSNAAGAQITRTRCMNSQEPAQSPPPLKDYRSLAISS